MKYMKFIGVTFDDFDEILLMTLMNFLDDVENHKNDEKTWKNDDLWTISRPLSQKSSRTIGFSAEIQRTV